MQHGYIVLKRQTLLGSVLLIHTQNSCNGNRPYGTPTTHCVNCKGSQSRAAYNSRFLRPGLSCHGDATSCVSCFHLQKKRRDRIQICLINASALHSFSGCQWSPAASRWLRHLAKTWGHAGCREPDGCNTATGQLRCAPNAFCGWSLY